MTRLLDKLPPVPVSEDWLSEALAASAEDAAYSFYEQPKTEGVVYFFGGLDFGNTPIQIGYTRRNLAVKLQDVQKACFFEVMCYAVEPGGWSLKRKLHKYFQRSCLNGEWYKPTPKLLAYIRKLQEAWNALYEVNSLENR